MSYFNNLFFKTMKINSFSPEFKLSSLNGTNGFTLNGVAANDQSGFSVSRAGDINGDGIEDIIVGAPDANKEAGASYVVFGHKGDWPAAISLSKLDGVNGFTLKGVPSPSIGNAGFSVKVAGDINGDSISDVIIGSITNGNQYSGAAYVVFGRKGIWPETVQLDNLNGKDGLIMYSVQDNNEAGFSVSGAGDVNSDGIDDVIIGAPFGNLRTQFPANAYVVFGKKEAWPEKFPLNSLNGVNGFTLTDNSEFSEAGYSVSTAGDINNDSIADVIIGNFCDNNDTGVSYILFGRKTPWPPTLSLNSIDGANGFIVNGTAPGQSLGYSGTAAGDVNADGVNDIIIGAPGTNDKTGAGYVIFGHSGAWPKIISIGDLNGSNGFTLNGTVLSSVTGISVSSAGDFNGDDIDDIIIGAPFARLAAGNSYLVFGKKEWPVVVTLSNLSSNEGLVIKGSLEEGSGIAINSAGDFNGDNLNDIIIGGAYYNDAAGASYVVFGQKANLDTNQSDPISQEMQLFKKSYENITNWLKSKQRGSTDQSKELLTKEQIADTLLTYEKISEKLEFVINQLNTEDATTQNLLKWLEESIVERKFEAQHLMEQSVVNRAIIIGFFENIQALAKDLTALVEDSAEDFNSQSLPYITSMLINLNEQLEELAKGPMLVWQAVEALQENPESQIESDSRLKVSADQLDISFEIAAIGSNSVFAANGSEILKIWG
jgi:hypothetical protein